MSEFPSGTVTFLFTDIEGSTGLWDEHPRAMAPALARHDEILRAAVAAHGGHIFATGGDGFAVAFPTSSDAMMAGIEAQRKLTDERWPEDSPLRVRMGIHTGEAEERDGDYFGIAVNRAARIMGVANGGQLVVSSVTAGLVDSSSDFSLLDLGSISLKGVLDPVEVFGVLADGLDWVDRQLNSRSTVGNLPRLQTEFVGSLAALQERAAALPQISLVTLTGSGGVGKTRAAIEVGWLVMDEFADGVWLVELGAVAELESVTSAVASVLGVRGQPGVSLIESIVDWCVGRRLLLILDNCEHVLDPVVELVRAVLASCPTVTLLTTSREPLGVAGEQVLRIPSLTADNSLELFCDRARGSDESFDPSPADLEAITAICARLDGIPLAVELAAARTRSMTPHELLERLHDRFRLLRGGGRGGLERQQTLRAAVTWSYQLLDPQEKLLFDRLSVFAGPFRLAAAEKVCADDELDEYDVVDLISGLVDKSMLVAERGEAETRYRQLETLRQYGEERLDDRGETARLRDSHLRHFLETVGELSARRFSSEQADAERLIVTEWHNIRAAHAWALTADEIDTAVTILWAVGPYAAENLVHDHRLWSERTLAEAERLGHTSAVAASGASLWAVVDGDLERALALVADRADFGDPGMGSSACFAGLLITSGSLGRREGLEEIEQELRRRLTMDPTRSLELYIRQALALMSSDRARDAQALEDFGRRTGNKMSLMRGALSMGLAALNEDPPATSAAIVHFNRASDHEWTPRTWARQTVNTGIASALVLDDGEGATEALRHAIEDAYDTRNWLNVFLGLDVLAFHLRETDIKSAATILGFVATRPASAAGAYARIRAQALAEVEANSAGPALMAHGATFDRHAMVSYALERLDQ
jgi:predicted ATPase/class 3 adenylate cyclase